MRTQLLSKTFTARRYTRLLVLVAAISFLWIYFASGIAHPEEKASGRIQVIEILAGEVSPAVTAIPAGTTVIWENITDKWVSVNFTGGTKAGKPCAKPKGFKGGGMGHPSATVPPGGSASLCLTAPGTYQYSAAPDGNLTFGMQPSAGIIVVRPE